MTRRVRKLLCAILQILDKTDTASEGASGADHVHIAREEFEEVHVVAEIEVLSGRTIAAVALHAVHTRTAAAASGREEDSTCGFEF